MSLSDVGKDLFGFFFSLGFRFHPAYRGHDGMLHQLKKWPERAASDLSALQVLIEEAQRLGPVERVAVVPPEGWMIVDLDVKDGKDGLTNFRRLIDQYDVGGVPYISVKTRTGGLHLYYRTVSKFVKTVSNVAKFDGVDIRGQGGFAYAPYRVGELDSWTEGEYLLFGVLDSINEAVPFNDRKLFLEHTKADDKKILGDDIRNRGKALGMLPKGARDEMLHYAIHEMFRAGYSAQEAHDYLNWMLSICEQDDEIRNFAAKFHGSIDKTWDDEKKLIAGSLVEMDVVIRALREAEIYALRNERPNSIAYVALHANPFKFTPYVAYGSEAFEFSLNTFQVADIDGKPKPAARAVMPRLASLIPYVDRRGFIPRTDVTEYVDPISDQTCVNTYRPAYTEEMARDAAHHANPRVWQDFLMFLEHLFGDKALHALEMIAWVVHRPDRKMITAPVFISEVQGVGKDTLVNIIAKLIGESYVQKIDQPGQLIDSKINISRALMLYVQELQLGKGLSARNEVDKLGGRLKTIVTESKQRCEEKYQQQFDAISFCNVFIASNRTTVAQLIDNTDRRYDIYDCLPQESLDKFSKFDLIAQISKPGIMVSELSALWLNLREVQSTIEFDRVVAPADTHKKRLIERDYDAVDQFLMENLPAGFSQHFVATMLAKSGMVSPNEAFTRAEYFIKYMLRREMEPIKIRAKTSGQAASWQFSGCKSYRSDQSGCTWSTNGYRPARPYIYVMMNQPMYHTLICKNDNMFWIMVEDFFEILMTSSAAASMVNSAQWNVDTANKGIEMLLNTGSLKETVSVILPNVRGIVH